MTIRQILLAGLVAAAGGPLAAAIPAAAQSRSESDRFGYYEDRDWTTREPFLRGYREGRMEERRRRQGGADSRQFGYYEDRDWTTREPFLRGYREGRLEEGRRGRGSDVGTYDRGDAAGFRHPRLWGRQEQR